MLYSPEIRQAALWLYEQGGALHTLVPLYAGKRDVADWMPIRDQVETLTRFLGALVEKNLRTRNHRQVIFYLEAITHLGSVLLRDAQSTRDGSYALLILEEASFPFISKPDWQSIDRNFPYGEERISQIRKIGDGSLRAYLVGHGRPDLADAYGHDLARALAFDADYEGRFRRLAYGEDEVLFSPWLRHLSLAWEQSIYALILLAIVELLSHLAGPQREKEPEASSPWWQWALLMIAAFAPAHLFAPFVGYAIYDGGGPWPAPWREQWYLFRGVFWVSRATFLLILIVPIVGALLKRRRQPPEARLGKVRACLASFRTLLPPTVAVLLVAALALSIPAQITLQKWAAEEKKIIQQGEVRYWKIGQMP